jgi:hypothetical protein
VKSAAARLEYRARRVSETLAHARTCLGQTDAHSRDASISTEYGNLQRPHTVISNSHVRHDARDACVSHFIGIDHIAHNNHDDHDYPYKTVLDYNGYNEV